MTNPLKAGQLLLLRRSLRLGVDVDHVAGLCPLAAAHWLCRLQVLEPAETQGLEHPAHSGEGFGQDPGNTTERAALMAKVNGALQLQWIERPPLCGEHSVNSPEQWDRLSGIEPATCRRRGADSCLGSQRWERQMLINVSTQQPFSAEGCRPSVRVGMHGV